jgi:hypothetical protein
MPAYSGKFQYTDERGASLNQGPCQVSFDGETCVVTPSAGDPLAFDLGDVDQTTPGDWDLGLTLYTGRVLTLKQFGAAFSNMSGELLSAWRDRTVQCLLLEDLEEISRYQGVANGAPGEIRIFASNLAFLPQVGTPIQWRLAEVDSIVFDDASYSIVLSRGTERLVLSKLAKKTDEALAMLNETLSALREHAAAEIHGVFPFLSADQLARVLRVMPEGRSASLAALNAIHPKLGDALIAHAIDEPLKPYFDALRSRATQDPLMAGFKFISPVAHASACSIDTRVDVSEEQPEPGHPESPLFFWFFFPLPRNLVAWEATTGSGRATYFFRAETPTATAVDALTRGLALINFRREPVYLPDASLEEQPRYHRYAIGARKLPDLRRLRAAYAGRAIHSSFETWTSQVNTFLA